MHEPVVRPARTAVAVFDGPQHVLTWANPVFHRWCASRSLLGGCAADVLAEVLDVDRFTRLLDAVLTTGEAYQTGQEIRSWPGQGEVHYEVSFSVLPGGSAVLWWPTTSRPRAAPPPSRPSARPASRRCCGWSTPPPGCRHRGQASRACRGRGAGPGRRVRGLPARPAAAGRADTGPTGHQLADRRADLARCDRAGGSITTRSAPRWPPAGPSSCTTTPPSPRRGPSRPGWPRPSDRIRGIAPAVVQCVPIDGTAPIVVASQALVSVEDRCP